MFSRAANPSLLLLLCMSCALESPLGSEQDVDADDDASVSLITAALRTREDDRLGRKWTVSVVPVPTAAGAVVASSDSVGARCDADGCYVRPDSTVRVVAAVAAGYTFERWTGCSTDTSPVLLLEHIDADAQCKARIAKTRVPVFLESSGLGLAREAPGTLVCTGGPPCTVPYGATMRVEAVLRSPSARFLGWSGCSTDTNVITTIGPLYSAQHCSPRFTEQHRLSLASTGMGSAVSRDYPPRSTCSDSDCVVDAGANVRIYAIARPGSEFLRWSGDGCTPSDRPSRVVAPTRDMTCRAEFEPLREVIILLDDRPDIGGVSLSLLPDGIGTCGEAVCTVSRNARITIQANRLPADLYLNELRCNGRSVVGGGDTLVTRLIMDVSDDATQACTVLLGGYSPGS